MLKRIALDIKSQLKRIFYRISQQRKRDFCLAIVAWNVTLKNALLRATVKLN